MKILLSILLVLTCTSCYIGHLICDKPDMSKASYLTDSQGRIIICHGLNVSNYSKHSVGYVPWQTKKDFERMKNEWGFNTVRYLIFWHAIEPWQGVYDDNYIRQTIERLNWLRELDINVIVDFHQDVYGPKFNANGIPIWATNDEGIPFVEQQPWYKNQFAPAVLTAFRNFWSSDTLKNAYINMITYVCDRIDTFPNILGIEVMNEPFPPVPAQYVPKSIEDLIALEDAIIFEPRTLSGFYTLVLNRMESKKYKLRMFYEPAIYTSSGLPSLLEFKANERCVYYPHYYDVKLHNDNASYKLENKLLLEKAIAIKAMEAEKFKVPFMMGEWGVSTAVPKYNEFVNDFLNNMNEYNAGWTYYSYDVAGMGGFSFLNADTTETELTPLLVKIYPQRIAGKNPRFKYTDGEFNLSYDSPIAGVQTIIFIPPRFKNITITGGLIEHFDNGPGLYKYDNTGSGEQNIKIIWGK